MLQGFFKGTEMPNEATIAAVEPAAIRSVETVELPPYHYGAIFEKP